jgi:hypothetical protein
VQLIEVIKTLIKIQSLPKRHALPKKLVPLKAGATQSLAMAEGSEVKTYFLLYA